jgi:choline dehydrogenase-like flavoprotein
MGDFMIKKVAIVGSGPSGSTAARILIAAGVAVDMYDVGTDATYREHNPNSVRKEGLIPQKTLFGSSFMYRRRDGMRATISDNISFDTSHAKGGLSTVWGATVGGVTAHDIADWPVSIGDLSQHLEQVFEYMPLSAREDMIDSIYPVKLKANDLHYENCQSKYILDSVAFNAVELSKQGIMIGKAKLAIDSAPGSATSCVLCGQCMTGCERGSIFNAWNTVRLLQEHPKFRYLDHRLVRAFKEHEKAVELVALDLSDGTQGQEHYDAVILAAGCIDSTKIVDKSLGWTGHEYQIKDSQKYYFPVWVGRGGNSPINKSISLAHLYVQGFDAKGNVVQGQLYPGKLLVQTIFEHLFGGFGRAIGRCVSPFLNRFFVGVAYFSSAVSGRIGIQFADGDQMFVRGERNGQSAQEFNTFIGKLIKLRKLTGFSPLFRLKMESKLGHSQHFGGTIPMRAHPQKYESDIMGRPFGCDKVYIVDSTVLPSVPATPTTGIVMANAARIASSLVRNLL